MYVLYFLSHMGVDKWQRRVAESDGVKHIYRATKQPNTREEAQNSYCRLSLSLSECLVSLKNLKNILNMKTNNWTKSSNNQSSSGLHPVARPKWSSRCKGKAMLCIFSSRFFTSPTCRSGEPNQWHQKPLVKVIAWFFEANKYFCFELPRKLCLLKRSIRRWVRKASIHQSSNMIHGHDGHHKLSHHSAPSPDLLKKPRRKTTETP